MRNRNPNIICIFRLFNRIAAIYIHDFTELFSEFFAVEADKVPEGVTATFRGKPLSAGKNEFLITNEDA